MYSPVHATAGLLLAQAMPNPAVALLAGIASHYVLDAIPHGDTAASSWLTGPHPFRSIALVEFFDLGLAAAMVGWLVAHHPATPPSQLVTGAIGGILPDLIWGGKYVLDRFSIRLPVITPFLLMHQRWHQYVHAQKERDIPFPIGLTYQIGILVAVLLFRL